MKRTSDRAIAHRFWAGETMLGIAVALGVRFAEVEDAIRRYVNRHRAKRSTSSSRARAAARSRPSACK